MEITMPGNVLVFFCLFLELFKCPNEIYYFRNILFQPKRWTKVVHGLDVKFCASQFSTKALVNVLIFYLRFKRISVTSICVVFLT